MRIRITRKDNENFIVGFITISEADLLNFPEENKTNGIDIFDVPEELLSDFTHQSYRFKVYRKNLKHYPEEINVGYSREMVEDMLLKELEKIERFELLGIGTTTNKIKRDQLQKRLKDMS